MKNKEIKQVVAAIVDWMSDYIDRKQMCDVFRAYGYIGYSNDNYKVSEWLNSEYEQFTDLEKKLLSNIDTEYKWMARDENGRIYLYSVKPKKAIHSVLGQWIISRDGKFQYLPLNDLFKSIKWSDPEPIRIDNYVTRGDDTDAESNL